MKTEEPSFEIISNGNVVQTVIGYKNLDKVLSEYYKKIKTQNYKEIISSSSGYSGYHLFFNEETLLNEVVAYRSLTGFVDKNGEKIYKGDDIALVDSGREFYLNKYPEFLGKSGWYIRALDGTNYESDIDAKSIKDNFVVIHNVFPSIK